MASAAENYGQTFIRNENDRRYKIALEKLKNDINRVKRDNRINNSNTKIRIISDLFFNFMRQNFPEDINSTELINKTNEIIQTYPKFDFEIITSFTRDRITKEESLGNIGKSISNIIKSNTRKNNPNLVKNIIAGFVKGCLMLKPDNREDIETGFNNLLEGTGYKGKYNLEVIINLFHKQYNVKLDNLKKQLKI